MNTFQKLNNLFGWLCFLAAFVVYMLTLQPSVSFCDCGEFISTAYHLQVGHQPGAPLFLMVSKIISLLASDPAQVGFWMNAGSALASAATIMFLSGPLPLLATNAWQTRIICRPGSK